MLHDSKGITPLEELVKLLDWQKKGFYPVMAREKEMIRAKASIPVGIFVRDDIDVVHNGLFDGFEIERIGLVKVVNHFCDAEWKKMNLCYVGITCSELCIGFQVINKSSFRRIYAPAGTVMEKWWLTFFINKYLEHFLHFQITPTNQ